MKFNLVTKIIAGITVCVSTITLDSSVRASSQKYSCLEISETQGIYSNTERGKINFLNFTRDVSEQWSIKNRCETVAERFQRFYDSDVLRYIGASHVNDEPVLCAVVEKGNTCNSDNVLVTLPPNTDPIEGARRLMDLRGLAAGRVISVNGKKGKVENYVDGVAYYDLEMLEQLILETEDSDRLIPHE